MFELDTIVSEDGITYKDVLDFLKNRILVGYKTTFVVDLDETTDIERTATAISLGKKIEIKIYYNEELIKNASIELLNCLVSKRQKMFYSCEQQ
jgi:hypothetical protein